PKTKVCGACGAEFSCTRMVGPCWCEDVKIGAATLADLRARFSDCLCPNCLRAAAAGREFQKEIR
ncbi:MAG: cysteine-rich CWC family protein, partial [Bryobacteraceae bacterium]